MRCTDIFFQLVLFHFGFFSKRGYGSELSSDESYPWAPSLKDSIPVGAVIAGFDDVGSPLYIGRTVYYENLLPALINGSDLVAYATYDGEHCATTNYEVLCNTSVSWKPNRDGHLFRTAIPVGVDEIGEKLYMGRAMHEKGLYPGMVVISERSLYAPIRGNRISFEEYDLLVKPYTVMFEPGMGRYRWISYSNGSIPATAVKAGHDKDKSPLYAGRAAMHKILLPAKISGANLVAYVSYNGKEYNTTNYEVLCSNTVSWSSAEAGHIYSNAVPMGKAGDGEILYMGRVKYGDALIPGKMQRSHGVLYITSDQEVIPCIKYEILITL